MLKNGAGQKRTMAVVMRPEEIEIGTDPTACCISSFRGWFFDLSLGPLACFAIADRLTGATFNVIIPQGMFPNGYMYFLLLFLPHSLLFWGLCTGFDTLHHSTHVDPRSLVARVKMAVYIGCQTRSSRTFNLQVGLVRKPLKQFAYMVSGQNP